MTSTEPADKRMRGAAPTIKDLRGSIVAIITPMKENGELDLEAYKQLLAWHAAEGTQGIVVMGTTGESVTMRDSEWEDMVKTTVANKAGMKVIAGTGTNCTWASIEKTQRAKELGADCALVVCPYYNKPTQEGMYQHFKAIADGCDGFECLLYNVPGRTVSDLQPETVARLSKIPNIVGIKEATGQLDRVPKIKELCGPDFLIYSGEDAAARELMLAGGHGVITVTGNVAPGQEQKMCELALAGKKEEAENYDNAKLMGLHKSLFLEPNPTPTKWALNDAGKIPPGIRLPLLPLSEKHHDAVRAAQKAVAN